eukprot:1633814-Pleurochrysis_carterae.AAC.3
MHATFRMAAFPCGFLSPFSQRERDYQQQRSLDASSSMDRAKEAAALTAINCLSYFDVVYAGSVVFRVGLVHNSTIAGGCVRCDMAGILQRQ